MKYGWEIPKYVNTFKNVVGVELLEGNRSTVCDTCIFLVKLHGEHFPEIFNSGQ